jgi:hypothetical protein
VFVLLNRKFDLKHPVAATLKRRETFAQTARAGKQIYDRYRHRAQMLH